MKKSKNTLIPVKIKNHMDSKGGHPHIILGNIDKSHVSIGITHTEKNKNKPKNHKLKSNPLGGKEDSYMKRSATIRPKREYFGSRKGQMDSDDYNKAKSIGDKKMKKYSENKKK